MSPEAGKRLDLWLEYLGDNPTREQEDEAWIKWNNGIDPPKKNDNEKESKEK